MELFPEAMEPDPIVVIVDIAHVAGAADAGQRAATELAAAQRNNYDNLFLPCKNCNRPVGPGRAR